MKSFSSVIAKVHFVASEAVRFVRCMRDAFAVDMDFEYNIFDRNNLSMDLISLRKDGVSRLKLKIHSYLNFYSYKIDKLFFIGIGKNDLSKLNKGDRPVVLTDNEYVQIHLYLDKKEGDCKWYEIVFMAGGESFSLVVSEGEIEALFDIYNYLKKNRTIENW